MRAAAWGISALAMLPAIALAESEPTNRAAYWKLVVDQLMNVVLGFGFVLGFGLVVFGCIFLLWQVLDKDYLARRDIKPMSFFKLIGLLAIASAMAVPFNLLNILNDLTGFGDVCLVSDVSVSHMDWTNNASACIEKMQKNAEGLLQYTNNEKLKNANLPLLLGIVQLTGITFFMGSLFTLGKHVLGYRDQKLTVGAAFLALIMSSIVISAPSITKYIEEFRVGNESITKKPG
jgi:hypothetical protein